MEQLWKIHICFNFAVFWTIMTIFTDKPMTGLPEAARRAKIPAIKQKILERLKVQMIHDPTCGRWKAGAFVEGNVW